MAHSVLRSERLEARLRPEQKARIERAASLQGTSVSDFVVQKADEAAAQAIQQHENWVLGTRDRAFFVNALLQPPQPGTRLRDAARRYREQLRQK